MMKCALITAGLLVAYSTFAQTQKGNGILTGSLSVDYAKQEHPFTIGQNDDPTSISSVWNPAVSVTMGRFWTDNWLVGLSLSGTSSMARQNLQANLDRSYLTTSLSVAATPFIRRYWQIYSVYLFAGAGVSVNVANGKQPFFDSNGQLVEPGQKISSVGVNPQIEAGINYFLTNRLGLQLIATASSLPMNIAGLGAGLVYWTGAGRRDRLREEHTNSQTDAGRWVLEGYFSVNHQKNSQAENAGGISYQSDSKNYYFSPSAGFFIRKNTLVGISIPIAYGANMFRPADPNLNSSSNENWLFGISPYLQHYWTSTRLTPYTKVHVGYTRFNSDPSGVDSFGGGVSLGLAYMAGQRFIIETSLANASANYLTSGKPTDMGWNKTWRTNISAGLTGNFAVRYVFQCNMMPPKRYFW